MYSLIKGYISSAHEEEGQESQVNSGEAVETRPLKDRRTNFRSTRSKSESSAHYLSWENVSFLGGELRKTISKGFQWIAYPSVEPKMSLKGKRKKPEGTKEYLVGANDSLAKIALRFDTTPSELTRINKLSSRMLFPGQTLFVPENQTETRIPAETPSSEPVTKPPHPLNIKENGTAHEGDHETVKLTKDVSWEEEEEEVTEHYLKIYAKYITDGQGIANGVLLITPHSVMFKPNVSDPLVMDRGQDTYSIATLMTSVTSAAMYTDIAAMAIHDPLKPGRFYLDAAAASTLSRQNSTDVETISESTVRDNCGKLRTDQNKPTKSSPSVNDNKVKERVENMVDTANRCTCVATGGTAVENTEDIKVIVHDLLDNLINKITELENSHEGALVVVKDSIRVRDIHSVSPTSEDSGIGCSLTHTDDGKNEDSELVDQRNNGLNVSMASQQSREHVRVDHTQDQVAYGKESTSESLFAAFSSNVKYWLGQGSYDQTVNNEEVQIVPNPATPIHHQPLYLCLRISKKHWCRHHSATEHPVHPGEELCDRDMKRREYWFAIPPSRTEQVYRFFQKWCPNIHNALDDDESEDDEMADPHCCTAEEEGLDLVETFYSNSPPVHSHPKLTKALSEGDARRAKKSSRGLTAKPGKAAKVMARPKPDFLEDGLQLPDMDSKSEILTEDRLIALNRSLPSRTVGHCWVLVYSTFQHGFSLKTLYRKMEYYDSPILLVVNDGEHQTFGALCSCPLRVSEGFYGTGESFLFKFDKDKIKTFGWTGENNFFIKGSKDSLAIGSGGGNFGLWLDEDLYHGRSHPCATYSNVQLSSQEDFLCSGLEAWTFV